MRRAEYAPGSSASVLGAISKRYRLVVPRAVGGRRRAERKSGAEVRIAPGDPSPIDGIDIGLLPYGHER